MAIGLGLRIFMNGKIGLLLCALHKDEIVVERIRKVIDCVGFGTVQPNTLLCLLS